jgi:hypothetical protein
MKKKATKPIKLDGLDVRVEKLENECIDCGWGRRRPATHQVVIDFRNVGMESAIGGPRCKYHATQLAKRIKESL